MYYLTQVIVVIVAVITSNTQVTKLSNPSAAELLNVLGKPLPSPEVKSLVKSLGVLPELSYMYWTADNDLFDGMMFYLIWKQKGIDLYVDDNIIETAWVYNNGTDEYSRYVGELPYKLNFDDNPDIATEKLGKLDDEPRTYERTNKDGTTTECSMCDYKKGAISIEFRRPAEGRWRIHSIALHAQKKP